MGRRTKTGCARGPRIGWVAAPRHLVMLAMGVPASVGQDGRYQALDCAGSWSDWSACDVECGGGVRERAFTVHTPAREGGRVCLAADGDTERMLAPECVAPCRVNCVGAWSDWSACSEQCDGGVRSRTFSVAVAAAQGGAACEAEHMATQETSCNVETCDTMLDCIGSWVSWSACSVPCGGGTRSRTYRIETREQNGGSAATCDIEASRAPAQVEACNEHACPVDCRGEWGQFVGCDDPCVHNAMAERRYRVTTPAAFGGRATTCVANDGAIQRTPCDRSGCPANCTGYWGEWDDCSVPCGDGGHRTRTYFVTQQARNGGSAATCEAEAGAEEVAHHGCNADIICPVDCEGSFSEWAGCSTTCGEGTQTRTYSVTTAAAHGGRTDSCVYPSNTVEERECLNHTECPVDCVGGWSPWSDCSATCGSGTKRQIYTVSVAAAFGGNETACEAANGKPREMGCSAGPCLANCTGAWGEWSACSEECGGTQSRVYRITAAAQSPASHCNNQTEVSVSRTCDTRSCWTTWQWAAGTSVLLYTAVLCGCVYERRCKPAAKVAEHPTDGYGSCASSEEEQLTSPTESRVYTKSKRPRDSLGRQSERSSIHDPEGGITSLSPISVEKISPPTKAELDKQIYARANRNPAFAEAVRRSPYSLRPSSTSRSGGQGQVQGQSLTLEPRVDTSLFDQSTEALSRSLESVFDAETTALAGGTSRRRPSVSDGIHDAAADDLERAFDAETTARSRTERDGRGADKRLQVDQRGTERQIQRQRPRPRATETERRKERAGLLARSARSSWEQRQLLRGGDYTGGCFTQCVLPRSLSLCARACACLSELIYIHWSRERG